MEAVERQPTAALVVPVVKALIGFLRNSGAAVTANQTVTNRRWWSGSDTPRTGPNRL